ncbi:MAG: 30S ribosome-binding factor RbfA [Candidatus Marinimicrobia bacterium]|nr:30S ribosome-binding factor RbfA [Candidatus Neomarinimicrobiota bacterium]MBT3675828.1 30S ribosome-binding factor RbfA [Candidatus Neomarinimicrobiota bacterium]MBT3762990.1 30S ribosome-binding factor RbfA [Candidatus Neomarinimicrobiota bacterium]MBT4069137.1 30S ribosome-binding factor RbfA [Candidatus Neomarinimicrobiota bacterium]MBT4271523.1 30S ribosome-binding factor RbfA [Candidatus Neomarinimicrobiota bacterium]
MRSERPFKRTDRVANEIQQILGKIQTQIIDLSDLGFVTFSRVSISPDLKNAKIFFSVVQKKKSVKNLQIEMNNRAKAFRKFLGQELRIKYTPKLKFFYDDTLDYTQKIDSIFHDISSDD